MIKGKEVISRSERMIGAVNAEAWENMGIVMKGDADKDSKKMKAILIFIITIAVLNAELTG